MIKLYFESEKDAELERKIKGLDILRLKCDTLFREKNGKIWIRDAIIDTGAFVTLIPFSMWEKMEYEEIAEHAVKGIVSRKECSVDVIIGKIKIRLIDEENESEEMQIYAYLALSDNIPLIIGFKDLLSKFRVCFDYSKNEAWIEEKK